MEYIFFKVVGDLDRSLCILIYNQKQFCLLQGISVCPYVQKNKVAESSTQIIKLD